MINGHREFDEPEPIIDIYLREIGTVPPISPGEERGLRDRISGDDTDQKSKKRLVESHLMMVVEIARQYHGPDIHLLDLIQQGNVGLMQAADRVAAGEDRFAPFAEVFIHRALREFVAVQGKKTAPAHSEE